MSTACDDEGDSPSGSLYSVDSLTGPEGCIDDGIPDQHPSLTKSSAGWLGATTRLLKGIPPNVWVANGSSTPITVVVHKFKPNIQMTGAGVDASAAGGGINGEGEVWYNPSTKKELQPNETAVFPLWSRKNGDGSVSIYRGTGTNRVLFIANDRIKAGHLATFRGGPDLYVVDFKGTKVS